VFLRNYDCDHSKAYKLYAKSVRKNQRYKASKCKKYLEDCNLGSAYMGGYPTNNGKNVFGVYKL
jgi:transposase-like protein